MICTAIASTESSAAIPLCPRKLAIAATAVALADWLFYGHSFGISVVLFLLALGIGTVLANPVRATPRETLTAVGVFVVAIAPLLVDTSIIGFLFGAMGVAYAALTLTQPGIAWKDRLAGAMTLLVEGFWRVFPDLSRSIGQWSRSERATDSGRALIVWIVPLVLGGVFLTLFSSANPLIEKWFAHIDVRFLLEQISVSRVAFWIVLLALSWPFIAIRHRNWPNEKVKAELEAVCFELPGTSFSAQMFGKDAILRSLILFNVIFAVQTLLDIAYLWGGIALPDGTSYASYAHRGAYPLIVTALLAAIFVILSTRPGSETERSPVIRNLVFLWIGQNVLLVISSILRLDLYVEVYSLTYWRVAAFAWMILVAIGLILIVLRIVLGRSNTWLIGMNIASLTLALYVCAFVNFPNLIANYNIQHSRDASGTGSALDVIYLASLGAHVIPALDSIAANPSLNLDAIYWSRLGRDRSVHDESTAWSQRREKLAQAHLIRMNDWRAWTYQDWKLARYLRGTAIRAAAPQ